MNTIRESSKSTRRRRGTDADESNEEKSSRALKRRRLAKNNNNIGDEENGDKMSLDNDEEQFQEDQEDLNIAKRTRRSLRNNEKLDHTETIEENNNNKSTIGEKSSNNKTERPTVLKKKIVSFDDLRSRALYKLKMTSSKRLDHSFCMTKHKHSVFTMDATVTNSLFAAGGGGGILSLFEIGKGLYCTSKLDTTVLGRKNNVRHLPPFLTFQVHDAWISGVKFLDIQKEDDSCTLLTSSDDAKLKLWQFDMAEKDHYSKLAHINPASQVSTDSGIYSIDAFSKAILTSCKSGEVILHELAEGQIRPVQTYIAHSDVAKHVRWRDAHVFSTCGNDKKVNVYDIRVAQTQPKVITYENAHSLSINTVAWQPGEPFRLMSSGFDQVINVFDLKKPDEPLFTITEHQGKNGRASSIHHPVFGFAGAAILTAADTSKEIYMFDAVNGKLVRTFDVGYTANSIYTDWPTEYFVAVHNQHINLYHPKAAKVNAVIKKRTGKHSISEDEK